MGYGAADQRHFNKVFPGLRAAFADSGGHLVGFADAQADMPGAVAGNDQRAEAQALAAFHHFGHPVDVDKLIVKVQVGCIDTDLLLASSRFLILS